MLRANAEAIAQEGRILTPVSDAQLAAAGYTPERIAQHRAEERAGLAAWRVRTELRNAATPEEVAAAAAAFAPGTDLFAADPATASRILALARERGAAIGHAALEQRYQDLRAEALATGRAPPPLTPEDAAAAGLTPEALARLNRDLAEAARIGEMTAAAGRMSPAERAALPAALPVAGARAAENAELLRVAEREWRRADQALREDPAGYALAGSPAAQELARRVQAGLAEGDLGALPDLVAVLQAEQRRLGVARPQALPRAMLEPMARAVAEARDPAQAAGAARVLLAAVGPEGMIEALRSLTGPQAETRREAIAVAAMIQDRQPQLARDILAGTIALRDTRPVDLPMAQVEAAAQSVIGNAFAELPAARAQLVSAARALYAAALAREGREAQPFAPREFRAAIERIQPFGDHGGRRVPLPPGFDQALLDRLMANLPPEALAGARAEDGRPVTPAMVARGGFELLAVAPGRFEMRYAGRQVLDAEGRPFRLDLPRALELAPDLRRPAPPAGQRLLNSLTRTGNPP
ncbi:MAG: hypothetical protein N3D18_04275 [Roseococcus sp.]|nr:hypothetical protein [Roseococcus sp.]